MAPVLANKKYKYVQNLKKRRKIAALCLLLMMEEVQQDKKQRNMWIKSWIERRQKQGMHYNLFVELNLEDPNKFRRYFETEKIKC